MKTPTESPEELYTRVRPLMDAVDLNALSEGARGAISTGELSGVDADDDLKRIMQLKSTGVISSEEVLAIIPVMLDL